MERVPEENSEQNLRAELAAKDKRLAELEAQLQRRDERIEKLSQKAAAFDYHAPLPPTEARYFAETSEDEGSHVTDDDYYVATADADAARLASLGVKAGSRVLDVGCGPGRVAIGLMRRFGSEISYTGVDVKENRIRWARNHLTHFNPSYEFHHLDVPNERYNPSEIGLNFGFQFPFEDQSFDYICLFSVFTHMRASDVTVYLKDLHRILSDDGRMFVTAFLDDTYEDEMENPAHYLGESASWSGPLHCVLFDRASFYHRLLSRGFRVDYEDPEQSYQKHLYLSKIPD